MRISNNVAASLILGLLVLVCGHTTTAQAQFRLVHQLTGEAEGDRFGASLSGAGDVDKDGFDDVIVGAPGNDAGGTNIGRAYVYSGRTGGRLYTFTGEAAGDQFGCSVSGAGDVNGDGYADFVVGAFANDAGGANAGRAYVYSGETGALLYALTGEADGDLFGRSVSGAGDVDNDGFDDVIVGANNNDAGGTAAGRAYVYSGQTGALLYTFTGEAPYDNFGSSVSGAGDFNNDGYADLIVGAPGNGAGGYLSGRAYVFSGLSGSLMYTFTGAESYSHFGSFVAGIGDQDNDGFADVIVNQPYASHGWGRTLVYSGRFGGLMHKLNSSGTPFSGSGCGDVNGDGYLDVVIAAVYYASDPDDPEIVDRSWVTVYSGLNSVPLASWRHDGDVLFGTVSGVGDVDNNGYGDFAYAFYNVNGEGADIVYIAGSGPAPIPTLTEWGALVFGTLLLFSVALYVRYRRTSHTETLS